MSVPRRLRPLAVLAYAAFVGLLLASYVTPLQDILHSKAEVSTLEHRLQNAEAHNAAQRQLVGDLNTPAGIERAARERYGMVKPGEEIYIIPPEGEE